MRQLASIQRVVDVQLHPSADRLDIIQVLGWNLVSRRGEFRPGSLYWHIARELKIEEKLRGLGVDGIAVQGEIIGPKVQCNWYCLLAPCFRVYSMYNTHQRSYFDYSVMVETVQRQMGLQLVPWVTEVCLGQPGASTVQDFVTLATRYASLKPDRYAEGIVVRPLQECSDMQLGRLSFKVINPEYELTTQHV